MRWTACVLALHLARSLAAAFEFTDINPSSSDLHATDPNGGSGGRVNRLAAAPLLSAERFAATEWGGLYHSADGGDTWDHVDGLLPYALWDVEIDPLETNRVYVSSLSDGRTPPVSGIQISTDGGVTWTHPPTAHPDPALEGTPSDNTPQATFACPDRSEPSAFGIAIRPDAPANVYVGTNCGLAISNDHGATWRFVDPTPATPASRIWDVVVQAGGVLDVCGDDRHLHSPDGGTTWTGGSATIPVGRCSIAVSPDEAYVLLLAASDNRLYESDDAGATWTSLGFPAGAPQGRIPFVVTNQISDTPGGLDVFDAWFGDVELARNGCVTPSPKAMGGANRCSTAPFWTSGLSYPRGAHLDAGHLVFEPDVVVDACPILWATDGGVYVNTNTGAGCQTPTWSQPTRTPHATWLWSMNWAQRFAGDSLYLGLQDVGSWASLNAETATPGWSNKDCCDVTSVTSDSGNVAYGVCCFTTAPATRIMLRQTGMVGGGPLSTANHPPGTLINFRYVPALQFFDTNALVAVTTSGVYITNDVTAGTVTWTQLGAATTPANACGIKAPNSTTFYLQAGTCRGDSADQVWKFTGTGAGSWTRIDTNGSLAGGFNVFDAREALCNGGHCLYASYVAPDPPQIVYSTDGGATWQRDIQLEFLMNGGGLFTSRSTRGPGVTTSDLFGGYQQTSLLSIGQIGNTNTSGSLRPLVVAGGLDSGLFVAREMGGPWARLSDPFTPGTSGVPHLSRPRFAAIHNMTPSNTATVADADIYVGTQGRGVWRIRVPHQPKHFACYKFKETKKRCLGDPSKACTTDEHCASQSVAGPCLGFPKGVQTALADWLESGPFTVKKPKDYCNPVNIPNTSPNNFTPTDPPVVRYRIKRTVGKHVRRTIVIEDQWSVHVVETIREDSLLVPTLASTTGPVTGLPDADRDHYKCYKVRERKGRCALDPERPCRGDPDCPGSVGATACYQGVPPPQPLLYGDPGGLKDLKKLKYYCAPERKDGQPVANPHDHFLGYQMKPPPGYPAAGTTLRYTNNAFGPGHGESRKDDVLFQRAFMIFPASSATGL